MSLNRYEQAVFDYWKNQPDERRHWQNRVNDASLGSGSSPDLSRLLERELWEYFVERAPHVKALRDQFPQGVNRVSLLNLAELMLRTWGPPPKPKRSSPSPQNPGSSEFS